MTTTNVLFSSSSSLLLLSFLLLKKILNLNSQKRKRKKKSHSNSNSIHFHHLRLHQHSNIRTIERSLLLLREFYIHSSEPIEVAIVNSGNFIYKKILSLFEFFEFCVREMQKKTTTTEYLLSSHHHHHCCCWFIFSISIPENSFFCWSGLSSSLLLVGCYKNNFQLFFLSVQNTVYYR